LETPSACGGVIHSNWSKKTGDKGGSRGRGKVMFLGASNDNKIYFDSLRSTDNKYIFGWIYLDSDKRVKYHFEEEKKAEGELLKHFKKNVEILSEYGTRVFIKNPSNEITKLIKSGEFLSYINNTWWEVIKKYQAEIIVEDENFGQKSASVPLWYEDVISDDVDQRIYEDEGLKSENEMFKIKKLVLRYSKRRNIPEAIKGIAIQRGGMTIERIRSEKLVEEEGMSDVYGWLEMDDELAKKMGKECEGPEHFDFVWGKRPARDLKNYVKSQLRDFANELKIIESENAKATKAQAMAAAEAQKKLLPFFLKLNLAGKNQKGRKKRKTSFRSSNEKFRLSVKDFQLPNENNRVNYGQKIIGTYVVPINETKESLTVLVQVYLKPDDEDKEIIIAEKQIDLHPGEGSRIGEDYIMIAKNFRKTGYSFRARMISLEDTNLKLDDGTNIEKSTTIYERVDKKFYVETDPPYHGPFQFREFSSDNKKKFIWHEEEKDGYIIYYNTKHPKFVIMRDDKDKIEQYLVEFGTMILLQIKLEDVISDEDNTDNKKMSEIIDLIRSNEMNKVFPFIMEQFSEKLWEIND